MHIVSEAWPKNAISPAWNMETCAVHDRIKKEMVRPDRALRTIRFQWHGHDVIWCAVCTCVYHICTCIYIYICVYQSIHTYIYIISIYIYMCEKHESVYDMRAYKKTRIHGYIHEQIIYNMKTSTHSLHTERHALHYFATHDTLQCIAFHCITVHFIATHTYINA